MERVRSELDALQGLRTGHVEIATIEAVTSDLLPCVLKAMRERYPDITVGVTLLGSQAIPEAVSSGAVDLGLAFALPRSATCNRSASVISASVPSSPRSTRWRDTRPSPSPIASNMA